MSDRREFPIPGFYTDLQLVKSDPVWKTWFHFDFAKWEPSVKYYAYCIAYALIVSVNSRLLISSSFLQVKIFRSKTIPNLFQQLADFKGHADCIADKTRRMVLDFQTLRIP